jgi:hypothetical protein
MVGARLDGKKELVVLQDGYRESKESWAELLRDLKKQLRPRTKPKPRRPSRSLEPSGSRRW